MKDRAKSQLIRAGAAGSVSRRRPYALYSRLLEATAQFRGVTKPKGDGGWWKSLMRDRGMTSSDSEHPTKE